MAEQASVPPHLDPKYLGILDGICPNTGERCQVLGDLRFDADVSRDSFKMGIGTGFAFDAMTVGQREAYNRWLAASEAQAGTIQKLLGGSCIGSCAPEES